jgi:FeS assembly SUF system regulator
MIKLSRLACYGVVILSEMAENENLKTASGISDETGLPEPTVAKILKLLAKGGFIESSRGVHGGYVLVRKPEKISLADIIAAMDGPVALTGCVDGNMEDCRLKGFCALIGCWDEINDNVKNTLEEVKLSGIIANKKN